MQQAELITLAIALVSFLVGMRLGWGLHQVFQEKPSLAPDTFPVVLCEGDRTIATLRVARRAQRLYYRGEAWDHTHTGVNDEWRYERVGHVRRKGVR